MTRRIKSLSCSFMAVLLFQKPLLQHLKKSQLKAYEETLK